MSPPMNPREALVIGAGIAGLATARALALRGWQVRVLEQAPALREVGAGLQIAPNGFRAIEALGLAARVRSAGLASAAVQLLDGLSGRPVLRLDLGRPHRPQPWLLIHRARLLEVLRAGAEEAGVAIETGRPVRAVEDGPEAADVVLAKGRETVPLVVGADGLHSRARAALLGEAAPAFTGQVAWRATLPDDGAPREAQVWMGPGRHLVTYPLAGGLRNLVAVEARRDWVTESWSAEDEPAAPRAAFAGFAAPVRHWLDAVDRVNLWGLFRHPVAPRWHGHRVALVGDAAHPTLPFLAQGANLALEDAWVLADRLAHAPLPEALAAYQTARAARVARAIAAANANAWHYHLGTPLRGPAFAALRLSGRLAPDAALGRLDWLYAHDVTV